MKVLFKNATIPQLQNHLRQKHGITRLSGSHRVLLEQLRDAGESPEDFLPDEAPAETPKPAETPRPETPIRHSPTGPHVKKVRIKDASTSEMAAFLLHEHREHVAHTDIIKGRERLITKLAKLGHRDVIVVDQLKASHVAADALLSEISTKPLAGEVHQLLLNLSKRLKAIEDIAFE